MTFSTTRTSRIGPSLERHLGPPTAKPSAAEWDYEVLRRPPVDEATGTCIKMMHVKFDQAGRIIDIQVGTERCSPTYNNRITPDG
jgi:hypothetical protein